MLDEPEVDLDGAESRERMSLPPRPKTACNEGAKERYHKIVQYKKQMKITSTKLPDARCITGRPTCVSR